MFNSTSQLREEITALTSEVNHLEIEISSNHQPKSLCQPCGSRWLSLSPYKRAKTFFEYWDEEIKESCFGQTRKSDISDSGCLSDSQDSNLRFNRSGSEHMIDELEKAGCRVLGILRCYLFNLETGILVTEGKGNGEITRALDRILEFVQGGETDLGSSSRSSEASVEKPAAQAEGSIDEDDMIVEIIDGYIKQVKMCGIEVDEDVVDIARRIRDGAMGRVNLLEENTPEV